MQRRVVWYDGPLVLLTCPVRELTPAAMYVLGLFRHCYTRTLSGLGGSAWQRTALPEDGPLAVQDAWLMAALDYVRQLMDRLDSDRFQQAMNERKTRTTTRDDE